MDHQYHPELIDESVFIAPGAVVLGDVRLGALSSVWYNAVLRGDTETISIGPRTNVQDGAVLHVDAGVPCQIGSGVTIGHGAVVHGAFVEDDVLIGIGAIVLSGARISRDCIIGAGSLVTGHSVIPPRSMVLGVPGRVVRQLTEEEVQSIRAAAEHYVQRTVEYRRLPAGVPR
ncbi:serine O-acetyltransferase [Thermoflexales bacterium]|nr:serine O-acetyltransferase [Thermoflexales bacterium]